MPSRFMISTMAVDVFTSLLSFKAIAKELFPEGKTPQFVRTRTQLMTCALNLWTRLCYLETSGF